MLQDLALPELAYHYFSKNREESKVKRCFIDWDNLNYQKDKPNCYMLFADYFFERFDYDTASKYYDEAKAYFERI